MRCRLPSLQTPAWCKWSRYRRLAGSQSGLTLIELLLAMALLAILSGFVANILYYEVNAYEIVVNRKETIQNTRFAIHLMTQEIREISSPDSIFAAARDSLVFRSLQGSLVRYHHVNGQLQRNGEVLLPEAPGFSFSYFDNQGAAMVLPINNPAEIGSIAFNLLTAFNGQRFNNQVSITPRNFQQ